MCGKCYEEAGIHILHTSTLAVFFLHMKDRLARRMHLVYFLGSKDGYFIVENCDIKLCIFMTDKSN